MGCDYSQYPIHLRSSQWDAPGLSPPPWAWVGFPQCSSVAHGWSDTTGLKFSRLHRITALDGAGHPCSRRGKPEVWQGPPENKKPSTTVGGEWANQRGTTQMPLALPQPQERFSTSPPGHASDTPDKETKPVKPPALFTRSGCHLTPSYSSLTSQKKNLPNKHANFLRNMSTSSERRLLLSGDVSHFYFQGHL